jgi:WD40 repeat protein
MQKNIILPPHGASNEGKHI